MTLFPTPASHQTWMPEPKAQVPPPPQSPRIISFRRYICHPAAFLPSRNQDRMPEHIKRKLLSEIKQMEHELAHELPAEIKKAVAMGDLSENAEYHMAKQRQEFVNARLGQLKKRMAELSLVNLANIPRDRVGFGSTVVVFDSTKDEELVYRLVTSEESDVSKGLISTTSPIGRGLVGKRVGEVATIVTPNGKRDLEVLKLTTVHDETGDDEDEEKAAAN